MPNSNIYLIKNIAIYTDSGIIENGYIKIESGKIIEMGPWKEMIPTQGLVELTVPTQSTAIPGLIDVHIHGVNGADVMDGTAEALDRMATSLPKEGTTSFLATTITQSKGAIEQALVNVRDYMEANQLNNKAEVLGIHLEGPFINKKMAGAQPIQYIINPQIELFKSWQLLSKGNIKLVTLAPEINGGLELIRYLKETGVIASIGHSNLTYEGVIDSLDAGATHATHLFNQMSGIHHREPGIVGAVFLRDEWKAELIADGIHVRPEIIQLTYELLGSNRIILITDSMRAKCLKNGTYELGGQSVIVEDGKAVLSNGTLAGSILKMDQAIKNMMNFTGCSLKDVIQMASENPARQLNIFERKGSLAVGKDADIVILDENLEVHMTLCNGSIAYNKGGVLQHEDH